MAFLKKQDLVSKIRDERLNQIIDNDDTVLNDPYREAEDAVRSALTGPGYDVEHIFSRTGSARSGLVLSWVKNLAIYYIYDRIPDEDVPERVIKNYDDTWVQLMNASAGKLSLDLPKETDPETGRKMTKFRGGSMPPRTHGRY